MLFLSTVRTRHSLKQEVSGGAAWASGPRRREPVQEEEESVEDRELGFLSSPRTLRSVLLCAQSLLAVVGDPVALCTMGKCRLVSARPSARRTAVLADVPPIPFPFVSTFQKDLGAFPLRVCLRGESARHHLR